MNGISTAKHSLFAAAFVILVACAGYAFGAQGFTDQHEEEHLRREAEAYSNGLKDGSLNDGLQEIDRIFLSQIKDPLEREAAKIDTRKRNNAEKLARLQKSREIIESTEGLVKTSDGQWMAPATIHGHGPLSF